MAENSEISWTDCTFNPWIGCSKIAAGCANCYAERDFDKRKHFAQWGPHGTRVLTSEANWKKPLKWNRDAKQEGVRKRVFCASLADIFEDWDGPISDSHGKHYVHTNGQFEPESTEQHESCSRVTLDDVRLRLFSLIDATPYLDWLLLTKQPKNILRMWPDQNHRPNVWLGTSISNQEDADRNIPELLKCRDLSPVLFLSAEPLLGPVDFRFWNPKQPTSEGEWMASVEGVGVNGKNRPLDWVICGGESGPNARPMHPYWARSLRDQCQAVGVPFHFKQWGEWCQPGQMPPETYRLWDAGGNNSPGSGGEEKEFRVGKKAAGRLLDGREWNEFPVLKQ